MNLGRITDEFLRIENDPTGFFRLEPPHNSDITQWDGELFGPNNTPYSGGTFKLRIEITKDFPETPPVVKFVTKIYHPNVKSWDGSVHLDILKDKWTPALSIFKVLVSIRSLLADPDLNNPLVPEIAREYETDRPKFNIIAREWTAREAM